MPVRALLLRDLAVLTSIALFVRTVSAWIVPFAPHVDAAYYTVVAQQLATGQGLTTPVLWSFLEVGGSLPADPALPVAAHGHWMPLPSIVAASGMALLGPEWRAGQVPMVVLSTLLVPMTHLIAWELYRSRRVAMLSAVLAIAAGSLLLMYPLAESFAMFGVLGAVALLASVRAVGSLRAGPWLVLAGAAVGLAALTRIDGVLLALAPATAWLASRPFEGGFRSPLRAFGWGVASAAAFLAVVTPWLLRNLDVFGTPFPSPGERLLWIRSYNEQFSIGLDLTFDRFLDWGIGPIAVSRLLALLEVAGGMLALTGGIFAVFFAAGLWRQRGDRRLAPFTVYFTAMFAAMVLLFTFHAPRGAFAHSAPAWLPFALPMAIAAVAPFSTSMGRWWPFLRRTATHRFIEVVGVIGAMVLATAGAISLSGQWNERLEPMKEAAGYLAVAASPDDVVMARDSSSIYLLTGLRGVAPPFDPYPVIEEVVRAYDVSWVVLTLEPGEVREPLGLWEGGQAVDPQGNAATWLADEPAFEAPGVRIFEVVQIGE
jgi:hypothetical protein